eukprot:m.225918 g.225918  ORF g.225918 m.225918 type:complete len:73 (-) comp15161_c0_seq44:226-444(-)
MHDCITSHTHARVKTLSPSLLNLNFVLCFLVQGDAITNAVSVSLNRFTRVKRGPGLRPPLQHKHPNASSSSA